DEEDIGEVHRSGGDVHDDLPVAGHGIGDLTDHEPFAELLRRTVLLTEHSFHCLFSLGVILLTTGHHNDNMLSCCPMVITCSPVSSTRYCGATAGCSQRRDRTSAA